MLFVGDDWAEDHHDVELQDATGRRVARARLPEGIAGVARLHELIGEHLAEDGEPEQVALGIETDRGPWVAALIAAGYTVYAVNPRQVARYRERHGTSGAKSDAGDAHTLADMARTDRHQLRPVAGDSARAQAVKVVARAHQTLIWDRHRHMLRLRSALREFFPAALDAFDDLTAPDALELLAKAPNPERAARLSRAQIAGALTRARRRDVEGKAATMQAALRAEQLTQPSTVAAAYAVTVRSLASVIATFNTEIAQMEEQVKQCFGRTRAAEIYLSQPGLGQILAARALGEFGDDPTRYATARNRKNYAGTSPITRASGKRKTVLARFIHNDRLTDALHQQAFCALNASPGARAYYDRLRGRGANHHAALRQLSNRLVGILHGCLKTGTTYDERTAWAHHNQDQQNAT
ncbi:IS110 family transposase [Pseudonocardia acaciae]|uniref:IS110 family transposase n=1 Tax=Pseudonocardia acaciae TaxID=551276 RepID=UPI00048B72B8|nr:IS110 family transposase [Pseudonocardia acaciae]